MNWLMLREYAIIAWQGLKHRQKRAWLTIIGIFIGIMAVVALVSLGEGLEAGVNAEFEKLGVDKIMIMPATGFGGLGDAPSPLTDNDVQRVADVSGVREAAGASFQSARIEWADEIGYYYVMGVPSGREDFQLLKEAFILDVESGRELLPGDTFDAIVGFDYTRREVFASTLDVGSKFTLNNQTFRVVGIRERIGNPEDDRQIAIPIDVYNDIVTDKDDEFSMIVVRVQPGEDPAGVKERIESALQRERNVEPGDQDFSVQTTEDLRESFEQVLGLIQVVLTGIAGISLLVGTVGIMNTMYTAVLERTKEIGIMKAIGATNDAILLIFLVESGFLGLVGGFVGLVTGLSISYLASVIALQALGTGIIQFYVSWWLVAGALLFSFLLGSLAGYLPARQAANMQAVDSLRYE